MDHKHYKYYPDHKYDYWYCHNAPFHCAQCFNVTWCAQFYQTQCTHACSLVSKPFAIGFIIIPYLTGCQFLQHTYTFPPHRATQMMLTVTLTGSVNTAGSPSLTWSASITSWWENPYRTGGIMVMMPSPSRGVARASLRSITKHQRQLQR